MLRHGGRAYEVGDVVWTVDPFKAGEEVPRMFATVSTRTHPFEGEQFIGATLTRTNHQMAHPLKEEYWEVGGTPKFSYILPRSIHTPRASNIQAPERLDTDDPWQGRLTDEFIEPVVDELVLALRRLE